MIKTVFILPLAKSDICRLGYSIESIRRHSSDYIIAIILDGVNSVEKLPQGDDLNYHQASYISKGHWGAIWINQMTVIREYLSSSYTDNNTIYVKIDSDAVIIREGVYERAASMFTSRLKVGLLGQVFTDCVGNQLHNSGWANFFEKTYGLRGLKMFLTGKAVESTERITIKQRIEAWYKFRSYIKNNPTPQSFGIGGCYILRSECAKAIIESGVVNDKTFLLTPNFGEDVIMGLLVGACGYYKMDDGCNSGLFAVGGIYNKYKHEFRANPIEIAKRGHYIIHPTKFGYKDNQIEISEEELIDSLMNISKQNV